MPTAEAQRRGVRPTPQPQAWTVSEFCSAYKLSRTTVYELWRRGEGPRHFKAGGKVLITVQAAREWAGDARAAA